jgi:monoamine oxidase
VVGADLDVIVIGAGAAGLAALAELERAGKRVICFEARDRIGGRIFTLHDPLCAIPIELGAEFVHGRPPEIWDLVRDRRLALYDCIEKTLHIANGKIEQQHDAWVLVGEILDKMKHRAADGADESFDEFLASLDEPAEAKEWARGFIEGFNAAHAKRVSIKALAAESEASDEIDGDRTFRIMNGYDAVAGALLGGGTAAVRLNSIVEGIGWSPGSISAHVRSAISDEVTTFRAKHAVITVGLGTLQTGALRFDPQPTQNLQAARQLCLGQVVRIVMRFRKPVWTENAEFAEAGFLLSKAPVFPTWWSTLPVRVPVLTAWSAGPKADALAALDRADVIARALTHLAQITGISEYRLKAELEQAYMHDWATDPFSRGAYSYVPKGASDARRRLAAPVENTLFFAGEAAEFEGHAATVHGAIISGRRAAKQVLAAAIPA